MLLEGRDWTLASRAPALGGQAISVRGLHATYEDILLPLFGAHAAHSAAAAVVALEAFVERALDDDTVRIVLEASTSPGRLEIASRHPLLVLDGAHNPAAAAALAEALPEAFTWDRLHLVMGVFSDKALAGILEWLGPLTDAGYAAPTASARARPAREIAAAMVAEGLATETFPSVADALAAARGAAAPGDLILVTGSLYTVADARRALAREVS